ncbi:hypothetical protein [Flavobacterium crassostreae]|uniref:DUF2946 domain-containing protein n=1 Tax=Flavobacterium crassostreae TaxID=1763534 RepID=A0A1B9E3Z7_9FLAO|nr:hypothetical protein [Flavobacterium crassostreae]OCB76655.1 hypothetical protein LPBF_06900 [Flavobacterium crassostreae]
MKKKSLVLSLSLAMTVLFSILFQSLHTYAHFVAQFSQTECHHKPSNNTTEITHQHHAFEQCTVCHFTLGNYVSPSVFSYVLHTNYKLIPYFLFNSPKVVSFSGSLYSYRGPPVGNLL